MRRIKKIVKAEVWCGYRDGVTRGAPQVTYAVVTWKDARNNRGETAGRLPSMHMNELLKRARREGVKIWKQGCKR